MIRVAIADGHPVARYGVRSMLAGVSDIVVVAAVSDPACLPRPDSGGVDVLVCDPFPVGEPPALHAVRAWSAWAPVLVSRPIHSRLIAISHRGCVGITWSAGAIIGMVIGSGVSPNMRVLVVVVLTVLFLALVADRAAARYRASVAQHRVACGAGLTEAPTVVLGGFPFLTQVASGRYTSVDVRARNVDLGDLTAAVVHANLAGVSLIPGGGVHAEHVRVYVTMAYSVLPAEVAGRRLTYRAAGDLLAISATAGTGDRDLPVTVLAEVEIRGDAMTIRPRGVQVLGVATLGRSTGAGVLQLSRELPPLPARLSYRSVTVAGDGLHVRIGGDDVTVAPTGHSCGDSR